MNNKGIGTIFCLISAVMMSARYIAAAIFMCGVSSWNNELFTAGLEYVGSPLKIWSVISLITGIAFIVYDLYQDYQAGQKK